MATNILDKIFEIMKEYELLLDSNGNLENKNFKNVFMNDLFFNFIFEKINIEKTAHTEIFEENLWNDEKYENYEKEKNTNNVNNNKIEQNSLILIKSNENNYKNNISLYDSNTFFKECYKKIILKSHPDKKGDSKYFIKCKTYYEENLLIGLLYLCHILNIKIPDFNPKIIEKILVEIRIIQDKIINLSS